MGLRNSLISLALCATTSLMAFQSNSEEFINYADKNIKEISISAEQHQSSKIEQLTSEMLANSTQFNQQVILVLTQYIHTWVREDSQKVAGYLATLTYQIDDKRDFFKMLDKRKKDFNLSKSSKDDIRAILVLLDGMKKQIQDYVNLAYKGMEAKHIFFALQTELKIDKSNIILDDYWYSDDIEDRVLFLTSNYISENETDNIFEIEDVLKKSLNKFATLKSEMPTIELQKIAGIDFNALNKQHFDRVSFI